MPTGLDLGEVVALAQLKPDALEDLAVAAAVLHVALDLPLYAAAVRACLQRIPALRPTVVWLVPSLLRWLHVRYYEALYGPFSTADTESARVPPDWEELAVMHTPGPPRRLMDRPPQEPYTLAYQVKAWWAVRVNVETARETARRRTYGAPGISATLALPGVPMAVAAAPADPLLRGLPGPPLAPPATGRAPGEPAPHPGAGG